MPVKICADFLAGSNFSRGTVIFPTEGMCGFCATKGFKFSGFGFSF